MEFNIIKILLELFPGAISIITNRVLNGNLSKENLKTTTIEFFCYTLISYSIYYIIYSIPCIKNIVSIDIIKILIFLLVPIGISLAWEIKLKKYFENTINKVLKKYNLNTISLKTFPSENFFKDNKDHYIGVYKDDKFIGIGFLEEWDIATNSFSLSPLKENERISITRIKRSIILIKYGIKIDEYEYKLF